MFQNKKNRSNLKKNLYVSATRTKKKKMYLIQDATAHWKAFCNFKTSKI